MFSLMKQHLRSRAASVFCACLCNSVCNYMCVCVFDRVLGGETVLRETIRGALSAQRERYCLSHRGLCHHAAGVWHAGGGQTPQQTSVLVAFT